MGTALDIHFGTRVCVVGFGRAGQAITCFLASQGARVYVSDSRRWADLTPAEQRLLADCRADYQGGEHTRKFLGQADFIVLSPGVDPALPLLAELAEGGTQILGELGVAASRFRAPVIAITGTNGKTTVTELVGSLLRAAGLKVFVGGNIGTPIGDYLLAEEGFDVVVLEVSSFQLELCGAFCPDVALLLNLSPDHLDRHGSMDRYGAAKMRIFQGGRNTRLAIMNGDDPWCRKYAHLGSVASYALFGSDSDYDAIVRNHEIMLRTSGSTSSYDLTGSSLDSRTGGLNGAAALLAVSPFTTDAAKLQPALRDYQTGAHRMQRVGSCSGVVFINDSKATNTGAVNSGLEQAGGPVILIAGGKDKGDDYRQLRHAVQAHVKFLLLIGEAAQDMGAALSDLAETEYPVSLEDAVRRAAEHSEPGDTVLLSPACASFDMFESYIQRGERFVAAVQKLQELSVAGGAQ